MPSAQRRRRTPQRSEVPAEFRGAALNAPAATPAVIVPFQTPGFITERQWKYICDMMDSKDLLKSEGFFDKVNAMDAQEYAAYIADLKEKMRIITRPKASEVINALKALPYKPRDDKATAKDNRKVPEVPEGHYALRYPSDELNPVRFYKVTHGKDKTARGGKNWVGAIFVERFASDDTFNVKYRSAEYFRVLKEISEDWLAAAQLYGDEFERCCICNRGLTRRISRKMRIGPVCLRKHGSAFVGDVEEYISNARQELAEQGLDPDEKLPQSRNHSHIMDHS